MSDKNLKVSEQLRIHHQFYSQYPKEGNFDLISTNL